MSSMLDTQAVEVDYDPFAGGALARVVPLTGPQREIWFADRLGDDGSLGYNLAMSIHLRGALNRVALLAALRDVVARHESLRATVTPEGDMLCIGDAAALMIDEHDLTALPPEARETGLKARMDAAVSVRFDLERGPLVRADLVRLAEDDHLLLLTVHHVICDGWSCGVIVRDLGLLYAQHRGLTAPSLPDADGFGAFALEEAERQSASAYCAEEDWWVSQFTPVPAPLDLPTDRPRPAQRSTASARFDRVLDATLVDALKRTGAKQGATLFATLLAGLSTLLARLSGQETVVIGVPAAGQAAHRRFELVGHCVSLLPLRFDVDLERTFDEALVAARGTVLAAMEHQHCTFGTVLSRLKLPRDPARVPLVNVMFNLDRAIDAQVQFPGLEVELGTAPRTHETFELSINAVQTGHALRLECQYNTALFDEASVRGWIDAFEALLRAGVDAGATAVGRLPLLDEAGRERLAALQPAPVAFDRECRMHEHLERSVDAAPDRIALSFGHDTWTYAELESRANRIAHLLRAHGVERGARVGIMLERGGDLVAALLGALKAGAAYVPLDPRYPRERVALMASDAGLAALITQSSCVDTVSAIDAQVLVLDRLAARLDALPDTRPGRDEHAARPDDVAYVIYTSGSTGRPKGVQVPHRAVANFLQSMAREPGLAADDCLVAVTTLSFDIAVLELMLPLSVGARVAIADRDALADGAALRALIESSGATVMQATPSTWRLLLDAGWRGSATFKALCGGEAMPRDLAARLVEACGELWNLYGPTETTVWSTCARIERNGMQAPDVHIGRPVANTQVWVLDARGEPVPRGVAGELCIGGEGVTLGYLGRPDLTADRFVADPFAAHPSGETPPRLYRTGDRGRWRSDGVLEHLGRLDHQIKLRGFRIEPGEIEAALLACDGVAEATVLVREDRADDKRLVAYVVPRAGAMLDEARLRADLKSALPAHLVPQHIVALDAMPRLPNGKLDRNTLPMPSQATPADAVPEAAMDVRTAYLADIWTDLLGARPRADDNFFDLGGHSMLAVQMINRVARDTGVQIKLIRLGAETLAQLASDLPESPTAPAAATSAASRLGSGLRRLFGRSTAEAQ
jgi:amino acid adenylation domain-containing protein